MGPFFTSALVAALASVSLVQAVPAAPAAPIDKKASSHRGTKASGSTDTPTDGPNLARDLATLTYFGSTITSDPQGILQNWTAAGSDVCSFNGVICDVHPDGYLAVAGIDFNGFQFGSNLRLDGLLDALTDITFFHANSNNFVGTIPADLRGLEFLYEIDLSNNALSGTFPTQVLDGVLTFLDLRFNQFTGPLPPNIFTTTDMDVLFLNDNQFSGPLPEAGGVSTIYITLANNQFTGPIPESYGNLKSLKEILFLGNQLTGTVPESLCALDLDVLDVSNNPGLTGQLGPKCVALLQKEVLVIDGTNLVYVG